jgi:hypothetical protein
MATSEEKGSVQMGFFLIMMVVDEEEIMVRISVCLW